jgi:hypothetical protein
MAAASAAPPPSTAEIASPTSTLSAPDAHISENPPAPAEAAGADPTSPSSLTHAPADSSPRPLRIYTRVQALALAKSPLVVRPIGMPSLKDWFGCACPQSPPIGSGTQWCTQGLA